MTTPPAPPAGPDRDADHDLGHDLVVRRWRMVLGRYAESALPRSPGDAGLDDALAYLYDREYTGRGHVLGGGSGGAGGIVPLMRSRAAPSPGLVRMESTAVGSASRSVSP